MVTYGGFPTQVLSGPLRRTPNLNLIYALSEYRFRS